MYIYSIWDISVISQSKANSTIYYDGSVIKIKSHIDQLVMYNDYQTISTIVVPFNHYNYDLWLSFEYVLNNKVTYVQLVDPNFQTTVFSNKTNYATSS